MKTSLKRELLDHGATVVGIAGLRGYLSGEIAHLDRAVSIGVDRKLNEDTLVLLVKLQKRTARFLKARGHRTLVIPPDSDRQKGTFISKLYSLFNHKMAATSAGLGWIGKNGLLISPRLRTAPDACDGIDRCADTSGCADRTLPVRRVQALHRALPLEGHHRVRMVAVIALR